MTITPVASASQFAVTSAYLLTKPAGTATGDFMIAAIRKMNSSTAFTTTPAGWSTIVEKTETDVDGYSERLWVGVRIAQAGDTTWSFNPGGNAITGNTCVSYHTDSVGGWVGVQSFTDGHHGSDVNFSGGATANVVSMTAGAAGTAIAFIGAVREDAAGAYTSATAVGNGYAVRLNGGPSSYVWHVADKTVGAGATGAVGFTLNGGGSVYDAFGFQIVLVEVTNTAPTVAYGASSLADGAYINTKTPTLTAYVTDPDASQTDTVTFEVATDSGFSSIVSTTTATTATPASSTAVSSTVAALTPGLTYYWRARVGDGTVTSGNTTTRTFVIAPPSQMIV